MKQNVSSYLWCCKTGSKQGSKECGLERPERARQKLGDSWLTLQPHQNQTTSFDPCSHKPHFLCVNTPDIFQLWHCFHCFLNSSLMNFTISNNHHLVNYCSGDPKLHNSLVCSPETLSKVTSWVLLDVPWYSKSFSLMMFFPTYHLIALGWDMVISMVTVSHFTHILRMDRLYWVLTKYPLDPSKFRTVLIC